MSNHIHNILKKWFINKDNMQWALASIIDISGSSYRKLGAMMLINDSGESLGMLSGGCLESDIILQSQKAICLNKNITICYETNDEENIEQDNANNAHHFLGCGGKIIILIQPLNAKNNHQDLAQLLIQLDTKKQATYQIDTTNQQNNQCIDNTDPVIQLEPPLPHLRRFKFKATINLAIFGAGIDAIPMVKIADTLGWNIYLIDHRSGQMASKHFPSHINLVKQNMAHGQTEPFLLKLDAAIIMGHHIDFDTQALAVLQKSAARYIGLLGPNHRKVKIIQRLNKTYHTQLKHPLHGPIGLKIGSELPEEIALSTIAEVQAVLSQNSKNVTTLTNVTARIHPKENAKTAIETDTQLPPSFTESVQLAVQSKNAQ